MRDFNKSLQDTNWWKKGNWSIMTQKAVFSMCRVGYGWEVSWSIPTGFSKDLGGRDTGYWAGFRWGVELQTGGFVGRLCSGRVESPLQTLFPTYVYSIPEDRHPFLYDPLTSRRKLKVYSLYKFSPRSLEMRWGMEMETTNLQMK